MRDSWGMWRFKGVIEMKKPDKKIKASIEFRFWYPAEREPEPEVFAEYKLLVPKKKNRKWIVPVYSIGHIDMNGKLICEKSKPEASRAVGCKGGKTVSHSLSGVGVCPECLAGYSKMPTGEMARLKAWVNGDFKVF